MWFFLLFIGLWSIIVNFLWWLVILIICFFIRNFFLLFCFSRLVYSLGSMIFFFLFYDDCLWLFYPLIRICNCFVICVLQFVTLIICALVWVFIFLLFFCRGGTLSLLFCCIHSYSFMLFYFFFYFIVLLFFYIYILWVHFIKPLFHVKKHL